MAAPSVTRSVVVRKVPTVATISAAARENLPEFQRALVVVERIEVREPAALDRVPALLDTIRRDQALSPAEAADALARGLAVADSL